ncbi:hypothetical protein CAEBREN_15166 [Caenorhabditis brenneri]|uniref:Uncharacterized protein n=1 Tax=Caenorhabditis brenneri TaxID=135651 RepID=G0MWA3_CAEBE|nr:hypothetical protein CAEBREN_15166 [Caenorhabditis brenneri]
MTAYPSTWFGIINDERWDVFPPYLALQKTNVRTGEREGQAFVVPPHIGEQYLRSGSIFLRPPEEKIVLVWSEYDDGREYAVRMDGQLEDQEQGYDQCSDDQYEQEPEYDPQHDDYYQQQQQANVMYGPHPEHYFQQQEGNVELSTVPQMAPQYGQPLIAQGPYNPQHASQHPQQPTAQQGPPFTTQFIPREILFGRPPGLDPPYPHHYLTLVPPPGLPVAFLPLNCDQQFVTPPPLMETNFYPASTPCTPGPSHQQGFSYPLPSTPTNIVPPSPKYGQGFAPGYFENQYRSPQEGQQRVGRRRSICQRTKKGKGEAQKGKKGDARPEDVSSSVNPTHGHQSIPPESENVDIAKEGVAAEVVDPAATEVTKEKTVEEKMAQVTVSDNKPESPVAEPSPSVQVLPNAQARNNVASVTEPTPAVSDHASNGSNGSNGGSGSPTSVHSHKTTSSSGKSLRSILGQKSNQLLREAAEEASKEADEEVQAPKDALVVKKKSVLTPSKSKGQLRREKVQALKAEAARKAAEFERMLEEQKMEDQKLQKEIDSFKDSLVFYIQNLTSHRNKHYALRKNGYGQLAGVQRNIVDFYKNRCVFLTKYDVQDTKVITFLEAKRSGYEKDNNPRLFGMISQMMELIPTTPIIQQDLYWLYSIRNQHFFKQAIQQLYSYILYSPELELSPVEEFTAEEVQTHFEGILTDYGLEPFEGFAGYLNRAIAMRSLRRPLPPDAPKPRCNFEKWITDDYIDFLNIDAKWTQGKSVEFASMIKEVCEDEEDMEGCASFIAHLPTIQSDIIDYDLSKFEVEYPDLMAKHLVGYFGLLIGGITDDYDDWDDDFLLKDF